MSDVTLCRFCGTLAPGMIHVDEDEELNRLINDYIPNKIAHIAGLPNTVCQRCREHLMRHDEFVEGCMATRRDYEQRMLNDGGGRTSRLGLGGGYASRTGLGGGRASQGGLGSQSGFAKQGGGVAGQNGLLGQASRASQAGLTSQSRLGVRKDLHSESGPTIAMSRTSQGPDVCPNLGGCTNQNGLKK